MPAHDRRSAEQARAAIEAAIGQIGFCLPGSVLIRRTRCGKPLRLQGRPAIPAQALHPMDPHRQRQDRHPAAHPSPVRGLRALVPQRPAAPSAGRRAR